MKRLLATAIAATAFAAMPAAAGTSLAVSVQSLGIEIENEDASPLSLGVDVRHDLAENFYLGGQLIIGLDDDTLGSGPTTVEVSNLLGVDLGFQHAFSHAFTGYAFVGLGTAEIDSNDSGSIDGMSVRYGAGARLGMGRNGVVDIGWASLFDDDMDPDAVAVKIAGPHVGLGYRF